MKKTITKLLALVLAVLMALSLAACGAKDSGAADKVELPVADGAVIGQGATAVTVEVTGADGKTVTFTVNTDEETLHQVLDKKLRSQILWSIALICLIPVWLYVVVLRGVPGFSGICDMLLNGYGGLFLCAALLVLQDGKEVWCIGYD